MNPDNHHDIENMQWSPEISDTPPIEVQESGLLLTNNQPQQNIPDGLISSMNGNTQVNWFDKLNEWQHSKNVDFKTLSFAFLGLVHNYGLCTNSSKTTKIVIFEHFLVNKKIKKM